MVLDDGLGIVTDMKSKVVTLVWQFGNAAVTGCKGVCELRISFKLLTFNSVHRAYYTSRSVIVFKEIHVGKNITCYVINPLSLWYFNIICFLIFIRFQFTFHLLGI